MSKIKIHIKATRIIKDLIYHLYVTDALPGIIIFIVAGYVAFWIFSGFPSGKIYAETSTFGLCGFGQVGIYREYILGKDELVDCVSSTRVDESLVIWRQTVGKLNSKE